MRQLTNIKAFIFLAFVSVLVLFFVSTDSYLHDVFDKGDSAWFFICGKSWMKGMVPYVDFADSKGPLLWLIYGVGYLLSHYNYVGVFWITCFFYALTLFVSYKTADIFLKNPIKSMFAALLMLLAYFNPPCFAEVRCEDFAHLPMAISLYSACQILYGNGKRIFLLAALLGISFAAVLLMKFNIAIMQSSFLLAAFYGVVRNQTGLWHFFAGVSIGVVVLLLPFLAYFLYVGCFSDFIQEYFLNTFITTKSINPLGNTAKVLIRPACWLSFVMGFLSTLLAAGMLKRHRWFPLLAFLFVFVLSAVNARDYYFVINAVFMLFCPVWFLNHLNTRFKSKILSIIAGGVIVSFCIAENLVHDLRHPDTGDLFFQDNMMRRNFYKYAYLLVQIPQPRIVSIYGWNPLDANCEALPACKYWSLQWGATHSMIEEMKVSIRNRAADAVLISKGQINNYRQLLKDCGYFEYDYGNEENDCILFSKHSLKEPPQDFHVTNWDILTKRRIVYGGYQD